MKISKKIVQEQTEKEIISKFTVTNIIPEFENENIRLEENKIQAEKLYKIFIKYVSLSEEK